jgi:hypothetical protein
MFTSRTIAPVALAAACVLGACNRNYSDIMVVNSQCDETAARLLKQYNDAATDGERGEARKRLIAIRDKQATMMERFEVSSMPEVKYGKMTSEEGEKIKAKLRADAATRLQEATALTIARPSTSAPPK